MTGTLRLWNYMENAGTARSLRSLKAQRTQITRKGKES